MFENDCLTHVRSLHPPLQGRHDQDGRRLDEGDRRALSVLLGRRHEAHERLLGEDEGVVETDERAVKYIPVKNSPREESPSNFSRARSLFV